MRISTLLAFLPIVAAAPTATQEKAAPEKAPLLVPRQGDPIVGKFIVKLKPSYILDLWGVINSCILPIAATADAVFANLGGFATTLTDWQLLELLVNPFVEYIEQETTYYAFAQVNQTNAPYGLARLSNTQRFQYTYTYDDSAGSGACAYVLDTGIDTTHPEFEGRATFLRSFSNDTANIGDPNGHGTHVAGIIGAKTYGVAKKSRVLGVTVLNSGGDGTTSSILSGMEYILSDAPTRSGCPRGFVVNMSLGGSVSRALNDAAANIVNNGLFLAIASGNSGVDVSTISPASAPLACTVGATDINDKSPAYSNFGSGVDILAPGVSVASLAPGGKTRYLSGTSQASPHIAGLAAYHLGLGTTSTYNMCTYLRSKALSGVISGVPSGTPNLLAQNK